MNIVLDYKIEILIKEGNKTKEKLVIFFREFTRDEKKEHMSVEKDFKSIFRKALKIGRKQAVFNNKIELLQLNEEYDKALKIVAEREKFDKEVEDLEDRLIELGGEDQEEFNEESAKDRFEILVSGKDKGKLEEYAEIKGYLNLMRALDVEKVALEKKPSGK